MTWADVARKDLEDAIRARWLWILSTVTILAYSGPIVLTAYLDIGRLPAREFADNMTEALLTSSRPLMVLLVPLLTIVMCYASITRERDSGSMKVLLSLPHSRRDIVYGKFLGRSAAVVIPVALALVLSGLLLAGTGELRVVDYLLFSVGTLAFVVSIAGLAVGLSAYMDTTRRAILASIGVYVIFLTFWNPVSSVSMDLIRLGLSQVGVQVPETLRLAAEMTARMLNPFEAYKDLVAPSTINQPFARQYARQFGSAPIVLKAPFSILVLVLWTVGPLVVGGRHFDRVDL
jgi:ABC-2 type transport system permease protein